MKYNVVNRSTKTPNRFAWWDEREWEKRLYEGLCLSSSEMEDLVDSIFDDDSHVFHVKAFNVPLGIVVYVFRV